MQSRRPRFGACVKGRCRRNGPMRQDAAHDLVLTRAGVQKNLAPSVSKQVHVNLQPRELEHGLRDLDRERTRRFGLRTRAGKQRVRRLLQQDRPMFAHIPGQDFHSLRRQFEINWFAVLGVRFRMTR